MKAIFASTGGFWKASILWMLFFLAVNVSPAGARWLWPEDFDEVKGRRLGDRFITEEQGDSLARQDLCFDCHDGSVLDNRELWDTQLHGHRADVVPKSPLPKGIPLIEGKLYCGSCHLPHGGLPGTREDVKKPFLRYENTNDIFCVACHQERATPGPQEGSRNHSFLKKAHLDTATADSQSWEKIKSLGGKVGKEGAVRCQSCHRPHGAPSRSSLIVSPDRSQLCSICHHDIKDDRVGPNHPLHGESRWKEKDKASTVECLTCHAVHEAPVPGILLVEEGEGLCLHCHKENKLSDQDRHRQKKLLDLVQQSGGGIGAGLCGACHRPHRASGKFLARTVAELSALDPDSRFCAGCHGKAGGQAENQIGPRYHFLGTWPDQTRSGARPPRSQRLPLLLPNGKLPDAGKKETGSVLGCRTCHFMHRSPQGLSADCLEKNLRGTVRSGTLCLSCHPDRKTMLTTSHNPELIEKPAVRERFPMKDANPCFVCHVVHRARTSNLYPSPVFPTDETDEESAACLNCHGPNGQRAEIGIGKFYHPIGPWPTEPERAERLTPPGDLPLLLPAPVSAGRGGPRVAAAVSCATCHRLHPAVGEKTPPKKYLRSPITQKTACVVCHRAQRMLTKTKHSIREPKLKREVERLFGKIPEQHECTPCHRVHNAKGAGDWFAVLPEARNTFEADERSRRCLSCHLHDAFKKIQEEGGHPIGRPMETQYLPSAKGRLHLGRIAQGEGGIKDVVVCATCHLNHGNENADGTITLFAGGGLPEGELCVTCHRENVRIVGSPHDFRTRKEGQFRPDGGRSLKFGVCAGCHTNHNASIDKGLIAFSVSPPKGEGNPEDMFCLHCHRDARVMEGRQAKFYVHPSGPEFKERLKQNEKRMILSSQSRLGEPDRTTPEGYEALFRIRCITCHDNHRWIGLPTGETAGVPKNEMASFLRGSEVAETLCANCHGVEALYRYRYFHQDRAFRRKIPND